MRNPPLRRGLLVSKFRLSGAGNARHVDVKCWHKEVQTLEPASCLWVGWTLFFKEFIGQMLQEDFCSRSIFSHRRSHYWSECPLSVFRFWAWYCQHFSYSCIQQVCMRLRWQHEHACCWIPLLLWVYRIFLCALVVSFGPEHTSIDVQLSTRGYSCRVGWRRWSRFTPRLDLNHYHKSCSKMSCAVFTGYSSRSKILFRYFKVGVFGHFLEIQALDYGEKLTNYGQNSASLSALANDTFFWVRSLF